MRRGERAKKEGGARAKKKGTGKKWRKTNGLAHTHSGSKSTGERTWLLGKYPSSLEMQTVCRKLSKKTRGGCILLKTVEVGNSFRNVERAQYRSSQMPRGPMRVRHDWDECWCTWSTRERNVRWCRAAYGWLDSYGSWYGRRRGCWSGIPNDVWFCETCRMVLWRSGAKVLSWNVSGNESLSQSSLLQTGVLKLGMTDVFHVGELIPRPKNDERYERTKARESYAHDGDKHMDEPKHRTKDMHCPRISVLSSSAKIQLCE